MVTKYRRPAPDGTVKGHYGDMYPEEWETLPPHDCPVCLGTGFAPRKREPRPDGMIAMHSAAAQAMSMEEILDRLTE